MSSTCVRAPGGKTTHLAELMRNKGRIVACDVDEGRLKTVAELCGRLGIGIVQARRLHPETNEEPPAGPFDAVLVDVPCSNTGVLGRRPEVRWRLRPAEFAHLVRLQTKLLLWAGERVRPRRRRGLLDVQHRAGGERRRGAIGPARTAANWQLEAEEEQVPGRPADGGYWARLRRRG